MNNQMGNIIKKLRTDKGITQEQLAEILGVSRSAVVKYELGIVDNMKRSTIQKLAEYFNVKPSYVMGLEYNGDKKNIINVYSQVHAGILTEMIEDIVDTEEIDMNMLKGGKEFFGIKVKGDSMSPKYLEGDTIIVEKASDCENGQDCVVAVNGNEAFLKRVFKSETGIMLQALNPNYEPQIFSNKEIAEIPVTIIGIVRELRRKI